MSFEHVGEITRLGNTIGGIAARVDPSDGFLKPCFYSNIPPGAIDVGDLTWYNVGAFGPLHQIAVTVFWKQNAGAATGNLLFAYSSGDEFRSVPISAALLTTVTITAAGLVTHYCLNRRAEVHATAGTPSENIAILSAQWIAIGVSCSTDPISAEIFWTAELMTGLEDVIVLGENL